MRINTLDLPEKLLDRYEYTHGKENIKGYTGLLAHYAFAMAAHKKQDQQLLARSMQYLAQYPEHFAHPSYSFEAYRVGGNPKAWLCMQGYMQEELPLLREYAEKTYHAETDQNGMVCIPAAMYGWQPDRKTKGVWIDALSIVTPFMLFAGLVLKEQRYIDFAVEQTLKIYDLLRDTACNLLHQAKGFIDESESISQDHWSRGNGWGFMGLAELVQYLPADHPKRKQVESYFVEHALALIKQQGGNGLWRQEITEPLSWYDSSGSGLILYGLGIGIRCGLLKEEAYTTAFATGIDGITKWCVTQDFITHSSSTGCLCPGVGAERGTGAAYIKGPSPATDEKHSYGCIALALLEAHNNGITEVELHRVQQWYNYRLHCWQNSV